jgi:Right handed beta helix region
MPLHTTAAGLRPIAPTETHCAAGEGWQMLNRVITLKAAGLCAIPLAMVLSTCVLSGQRQGTVPVILKPGQNVQEIVQNSPEGTRFRLEPGIYRQLTIYPKDGQEFEGGRSVVLSGAIELRKWAKDAGLWRADNLPDPLPSHGECQAGRDLCSHREDLFFNGRLYERVRSLDELGASKWYYEKHRAYLADDPTGQLVELGVTPSAFGGTAAGVLLRDLVVEKYASDAQSGAILADEARDWRIVNVTARWNHGAGLSFGPDTLVGGGLFSHNGQIGIVGIGERTRIEGVEISFNNYAGYDPMWEAGGTKFWETKELIVMNSCIHHNGGPGLWTDTDNIDTIYEDNRVFLNANDGIKHEISYRATIRNNIVARNGTSRFDDWLWGAQILIQNSSNVSVYGNFVEVSNEFGNGIGVIHQDRGSGAFGRWNGSNNVVEHNTIVHLGSRGQNGVVTDANDNWFWRENNNKFDRNTYIIPDRNSEYWTSNDRDATWDGLEELGIERHGELMVEQRTPVQLSCDG